MKPPRVSLAWLMLGTAIVAFDCAILGSVLRGHSLVAPEHNCLDMGFWPIGTALGLALGDLALRRRGRTRPFSVGFAAFGSAAVVAYAIGCRVVPEMVLMPDVYYINEIEPYFTNADLIDTYVLSLLIQGLILAAPQLLIALAGGLLARRIGRRRSLPLVAGGAGPPTRRATEC